MRGKVLTCCKSTRLLWPLPSLRVGFLPNTDGARSPWRHAPALPPDPQMKPCKAKLSLPARFQGGSKLYLHRTNSPSCSAQIKKEFGNMLHRVEAFWGHQLPPATEFPRKRRGYSRGRGHPETSWGIGTTVL